MKTIYFKTFALILFIVLPIYVCAQADSIAKPLEFATILNFDNKSQDRLFMLSKAWFAEAFKSTSTTNNKIEDPEECIYINQVCQDYMYHKKHFAYAMPMRCTGQLFYAVKIQVKENRIRFSLTNIVHESRIWITPDGETRYNLGQLTTAIYGDPNWPTYKKNCWIDAKNQIEEEFNRLQKSLNCYINDNYQNKDW